MKIHTKHLALCEKGGKFNKTHNTIYKLQEELIEPTGRREVVFFFSFVFANFCLILEDAVAASYAGGGLKEQESVFMAKMKSSSVFLLALLFHTDY